MSNKPLRIAINGFGRIGRQFFKVAFESPDIDIIAINDLGDIENLAYLLEFDSVYGRYDKEVEVKKGNLLVADEEIKFLSDPDPAKLPWGKLDIDVVIESTGAFTTTEKAQAHLTGGAKRVVISAPAKDEQTPTATPNVNEACLTNSKISSNASCTTNATSPIAYILNNSVGIKYAMLNTVHGYTASQAVVDSPQKKDFRRGRAAAQNIIPTSSGAGIALQKVVPELKDKSEALALRIPVISGSILDFTFVSNKKTSVEEINKIFITEAKKPEWKGIFTVTNRPIVSTDILKDPHGSIVDLNLTRVVGGELVKVMAWYDNEWGYVNMLLQHVLSLEKHL
jgi:glyceraldehyde 3-phosphate dehydrogenase